jgi:hypothetical protein
MLALFEGSFYKQRERKFFKSIEIWEGNWGWSSLKAISNKAVAGLSKLIYPCQGNLAVIISKIKHPSDHTSAAYVMFSCLTTSGAIQGMLPWITL